MVISRGKFIQSCAMKLHSEFAHVINFSMLNGQILSVVDESVGAGPSRIVVKKLPTVVDAKNLFKLADDYPLYDSSLPEVPEKKISLAISKIKKSLGAFHFLLTADEVPCQSTFDKTVIDSMRKKLEGAVTVSELIISFRGLGPGLTPAGDDFNLGLLTALAIFENTTPEQFKLARGDNDLVNSFLLELELGEINEVTKKFLTSFSGSDEELFQNVEKILNQGETSGADWLAGFIIVAERFV